MASKVSLEPEKKKVSSNDRIKELEDEISKTKYNKATQHHIGLVKAKIAMLKEKEISRSKGSGKTEGFAVRKSGDGTVVLLGYPSVGKSTLLNKLTNANSPVAAYAFTTLTVIPGLLEYNFAKIQVLDVPGIVAGAASGRGRGKEVLAVIRSADLVLILLDVFHPEHYQSILSEVYDTGVRLNTRMPDVKIVRTAKGGIDMGVTVKLTKTDVQTLKDVMMEFRLNNAQVVIRDDVSVDEFIDVIEGQKKYVPAIVVVNKVDMADKEALDNIKREVTPDLLISANKEIGISELKQLIFDRLNFIRLFLKEFNKKADMDEPMIMIKGATLRDLCLKLHRDFVNKFRFARIWGKSVKYPGQKIVNLDHEFSDKDIVELRIG